jgi:hypothetical protein
MSTEDSLRELFDALEELRKEWRGENRLEDGTSAGWWDCGYVAVQRVVEALEAHECATAKDIYLQMEERPDVEIEEQSTVKEMVEARLEFYKAYRKSLTQERTITLPDLNETLP